MGISGTVPAWGLSVSITKGVTVWPTMAVSSVNPPCAEPEMKVGGDTLLDSMTALGVVLFRGATDTVEGTPGVTAEGPELANVAPRIRSEATPVVWGTMGLGACAWSSTADTRGTVRLSV